MITAVLIPCYNEEISIEKVINDARKYIKNPTIYVFNNNSSDKSKEIALNNGTIVIDVKEQGKGNIVKAMFNTVQADAYLMVDGDDTYDLTNAQTMVDKVLNEGFDMVIGDRLSSNYFENVQPTFHKFGNKLVRFLLNRLFHAHITDVMTGLRVLSPKFVKNMLVQSKGFEIETEMSVYAIKNNLKIDSVLTKCKIRHEGSYTKTKVVRDGFKIIRFIFKLKCSEQK